MGASTTYKDKRHRGNFGADFQLVGLPGGRQPKLKTGQIGRAWGQLVGQGLCVESDLFGVFGLLIGRSWSP